MSSTNHTPNCALPQWVGTDPVCMTDFNAAFGAIDTALGGLSAALDAGPKLAVGTYTGNDSSTVYQAINVGFHPRAVLIYARNDFNNFGSLITRDCPQWYAGPQNNAEITPTGFRVIQAQYSGSSTSPYLNSGSTVYRYVAIG